MVVTTIGTSSKPSVYVAVFPVSVWAARNPAAEVSRPTTKVSESFPYQNMACPPKMGW